MWIIDRKAILVLASLALTGCVLSPAWAQSILESVQTGNRTVLLQWSPVPGDTLTQEEREGMAELGFAGYRVWRRQVGAESFELLRVYSLLDDTWTFEGTERVFLDPDSTSVAGAFRDQDDDDDSEVITGPVNGFQYEYSVTAFEAELDIALIPPRAFVRTNPLAEIEGAVWPRIVVPSRSPRTASPLLADVKVVPNPYNPVAAFGKQRFPGAPRVRFVNLPAEAMIDVYTVTGDRVRTLVHAGQSDAADWDLRNETGEEVSAGVYVFRVTASGQESTGRFIVLR